MAPRNKLSADNISNIRRLAIFIPLKISFSFDICHQLQIVSLSKRMKFLIVFVAFFGLAFGSDLFTGSWKEDQYKRENLGDYLYERGTFFLFFHYVWTSMSDMVKYRAAIWSFLNHTALYFTMSDIVHENFWN